ncbi:MAG: hypothetical protein ACYDGN_13055 [Acidimicrobiales bacterium]
MSESADPDLISKLLLLDEQLDQVDIPHAFGGAVALAAHGEPRGTDDPGIAVHLGDALEPLYGGHNQPRYAGTQHAPQFIPGAG